MGIIRNFKAIYRRLFVLRTIDDVMVGRVQTDLFKINQLEAMNMAKEAWRAVADQSIINCWKHAKILPDLSSPIECSDSDILELETALETLKIQGEHHDIPLSLMDACEFMDLDDSSEGMETLSIEAIAEMVSDDQHNEPEVELDEDSEPVTPQQALEAIMLLERYVTENYDASLVALLQNLHYKVRNDTAKSMKQSKITQFFQKSNL